MMILVCLFSFILYKMLDVLHVWIQPTDKYREPIGDSLKVNAEFAVRSTNTAWFDELLTRLKLFYFLGE
jgi:hypothetical protein